MKKVFSIYLLCSILFFVPFQGTSTANNDKEIFSGKWYDYPYLLLGTKEKPLIAFQISCYRYKDNSFLDSSSFTDTNTNIISPEYIIHGLTNKHNIEGKILLLSKCESENYSFILFQVGEKDYTIEQIFFEKKDGKYHVVKNIQSENLFVFAVSAHPFVNNPFVHHYDPANISEMDTWPIDKSNSKLRMYIRIHPDRYRILSAVTFNSLHLNRLVNVAKMNNLSKFVDIYSRALYPYIFDLYDKNPNHIQPFMAQLNNSDDIRILREIIGDKYRISLVMYSDSIVLDGKIDSWSFILEGDQWKLTPFLYPNKIDTDGQKIVVNSLIHSEFFIEAIRHLTMKEYPLVELKSPDINNITKDISSIGIPLLLSWPSENIITVHYEIILRQKGKNVESRKEELSFQNGETFKEIVIELDSFENEVMIFVSLKSTYPESIIGDRKNVNIVVPR